LSKVVKSGHRTLNQNKLTMNTSTFSRTTTRLTCLDETRAIAIIAMILIHFTEGVINQLPQLLWLKEPIFLFGRFATPAFITIFGITAGFVHFEKFTQGNRQAVIHQLKARTLVVFWCAVLVCLPRYINFVIDGEYDYGKWLINFYSILHYYTLGLLSLILWLHLIQRDPIRWCLILGVAHWLIGIGLYAIWPKSVFGYTVEYFRLYLVSGAFSYFALSGTALLAMPVGILLRRSVKTQTTLPQLGKTMLIGMGLTLVGWGWGVGIGEFQVDQIITGSLKAPPRPWYFMYFGGMTLVLLAFLGWLDQVWSKYAILTYPLVLFGQTALVIFTSHMWVLPTVRWLSFVWPLPGLVRILIPLTAFGIFALVMMYRQHLKMQRKQGIKS